MKNYIYTHLGMSRLLKFDEKTSGSKLNIVFFVFRFAFYFVVYGFGAPGGGFFSRSSSGGLPPLLLSLKPPPGAPKPPPVQPKP